MPAAFPSRLTSPTAPVAVAVALVLTTIMGFGLNVRAEQASSRIPWQPLAGAAETGQGKRQVIVVYFTAEWCGWCVKMQSTTFADRTVREQADRFAWAKIDFDQSPEITARFGVRELPTVMWFNADGELLKQRSGYINANDMAKLLRDLADDAEAPGERRRRLTGIDSARRAAVSADSPEARRQAVAELVHALAAPVYEARPEARRAVLDAGPHAWPVLIDALGHEQLAVRAAAFDLLVESTDRRLAYDPFAPEADRRAAIGQWRHWLDEQPDAAPPADDAEAAETDEAPAGHQGMQQRKPERRTAGLRGTDID